MLLRRYTRLLIKGTFYSGVLGTYITGADNLKDYATVWQAIRGLRDFFTRYNEDRPHSALGERTPYEVYHEAAETPKSTPRTEEGIHLKHAS
jgi:transposase InsO family protein